ncbi:YbaK/EbsC family protein [Propionispora hippei]|uniref:Cys-tRNA(Pro) deacylase, prolyl-tRNA editing enzyme YbaK/EbsC n=1 Tax=Propionispora hippei DSM 15287 TaxID=1123003 RepID=A0A1M6EXJ0_9FIRM|nr:YbaK/EbsC family protein [Propionispora hippei]SHI90133.1 Cys-tRNA(Pro) deacylase, prolyl-tRNA editing enzyme YbaK/EbsC [Propionispora hippei DSM 15287]
MAIEAVKAYFRAHGREQDILEFPVSSATVELAAQAAGVIPARIAKTLSFKRDDGCVLLVTAGDSRVDNAKFKTEFGCKARMLTADEVLAATGHAVGGVCPFAIDNTKVSVFADVSLKRFQTVFPACGSSNSAIELNCDELYEYSRSEKWVDVCKDWQG